MWAAGFFDGEGACGVYRPKSNVNGRLLVTVAQRDRRPLEILRELWGGSICPRTAPQSSRQGYLAAPTFVWTIVARDAARALAEMEPFLIVKHEHARLGVEYQQLVRRVGGHVSNPHERAALEAALRVLNAKGRNYRTTLVVPAAFAAAFAK